jgi:hypothetical protein
MIISSLEPNPISWHINILQVIVPGGTFQLSKIIPVSIYYIRIALHCMKQRKAGYCALICKVEYICFFIKLIYVINQFLHRKNPNMELLMDLYKYNVTILVQPCRMHSKMVLSQNQYFGRL